VNTHTYTHIHVMVNCVIRIHHCSVRKLFRSKPEGNVRLDVNAIHIYNDANKTGKLNFFLTRQVDDIDSIK